jgi:hypothetical protein
VGYLHEDGFSSDTGVWRTGESAKSESYIEDGHLVLKIKTPQFLLWSNLPGEYGDVRIETVAHPQTDASGYEYGFMFREEDSDNYYLAGVSSDGKYAFGKLVKDEWVTLVPWTSSGVITFEENVLLLVCVGDQIDFYANDTLLFSRKDSSFARGGLGLYAATGHASSTEVWFTRFSAYEATESDLALPTPTPRPPTATPTPVVTWADRLYADVIQTREEYRVIHGWYYTLLRGEAVRCPAPDYRLHRPNYEVSVELPVPRSIYDRYLAACNLVDGGAEFVGPLDRVQLLCSEGKDIGWNDMQFDMTKLEEAGNIFDTLVRELEEMR